MTAGNNNIRLFLTLWSEICKPNAWASAAYFFIWYPPWTVFCILWVLQTGAMSAISLLFPPLGYFICVGTVITWRQVLYINYYVSLKFPFLCFNYSHLLIDRWQELS